MQMEHADYVELKTQLQNEFDGRYVLIDDCERTVKEERLIGWRSNLQKATQN